MITPELKKLKKRLIEVSREHGSFSVDLRIDMFGMSVCFNCIATSNVNSELVYTVAGTEFSIVENLRNAMVNYTSDLAKARFANQMFPGTMEALDELTIIK